MNPFPCADTAAGNPWHALYTRHQHEKAVVLNLSGKGFEVFLPLYTAAHRWADRTKQVWLPLFPNYVFVRGGLDRTEQILATPGLYDFVRFAGRPALIPEAEIAAVRQLVESSLRYEPHPYLKCGDRVRVKSGPLAGVEGILMRKKNVFRLVLSVEMLGRSAAVEVDVGTVYRVARQNPEVGSSREDFDRAFTRATVPTKLVPQSRSPFEVASQHLSN